ncbi:MAG: rod shape-determining protein MreD [Treponema sp.]|nr:rod shape-determining protein MreD [Treponema sp.]
MIKSYISSFLILIVFVLIETALLSNIFFLPAMPDFLLLCVLYFSIRNGKVAGELTGFASGLLLDFLSGSPFGLNCLVRTAIGFFAGFFHRMMNYESFFVNSIAGFFATLLKAGLIYFISLLFPNYVNSYHIYSSVFALELAMNTVLCPIVIKLLRSFDSFIVPPGRGID